MPTTRRQAAIKEGKIKDNGASKKTPVRGLKRKNSDGNSPKPEEEGPRRKKTATSQVREVEAKINKSISNEKVKGEVKESRDRSTYTYAPGKLAVAFHGTLLSNHTPGRNN